MYCTYSVCKLFKEYHYNLVEVYLIQCQVLPTVEETTLDIGSQFLLSHVYYCMCVVHDGDCSACWYGPLCVGVVPCVLLLSHVVCCGSMLFIFVVPCYVLWCHVKCTGVVPGYMCWSGPMHDPCVGLLEE